MDRSALSNQQVSTSLLLSEFYYFQALPEGMENGKNRKRGAIIYDG
jgi:hypothetical protein